MSFFSDARNDFRDKPLLSALKYLTPPGLGITAAGYGVNEIREVNAPKRIGEKIGSSSFDSITGLNKFQQDQIANFDERQAQQYRDAVAQTVSNEVRAGRMTESEAQQRLASASFNISADGITNSGQLQQGAMSATDLPEAAGELGNVSNMNIGEEYWQQLRNAAQAQENITQGIGDQQVSREFDRTLKYRLPLEDYRIKRDYRYGQAAETNAMRRNMAQNLLGSYTNTAQQLIASGL
jgi:peptidoglycan hydrolase-like protein with peptidoglycan-binding domain